MQQDSGARAPESPQEKTRTRPARTQVERVAESDSRLLAAALKLIGERGYRGTSLAAIGEAAGYSRGLVHERFGSKSGLLWALVQRMLRVWGESRAHSDASHTGVDVLIDIIENHRREVSADRGIRTFYALMFEATGPTPELVAEFRQLHHDFRAFIERKIRAGIEGKTIRADIDPAAHATLMLAGLRGITFQWLLDPEGFPLDAAYEELKKTTRRVLSP